MKSLRMATAGRWLPTASCLLALSGCGLFVDDGKRLDSAESALARGDYNESMVVLHDVLEDSPGNARAQLLATRTAIMLGDFKAAESTLAAAEKAGAAGIPRVRAELLLRSGQYDKLLEWLDHQTAVPAPGWVSELRVRALGGLGRCDEAISLGRALVADEQFKGRSRLTIAGCYARHGNLARAERELRAATSTAADDAEAWLTLGGVLKAQGDARGAEQAWSEAARHAPGKLSIVQQVLLYSGLADLQSEHGDLDGLRATHQRLVAIAPGAPIVELLNARIALLQGKTVDAVTTLRRLLTKSPELSAVHALVLSGYLEQGNLEQARVELGWLEQKLPQDQSTQAVAKLIDGISKAKPGSSGYFLALAAAQGRLGLLDLAHATLERGRRELPTEPALALAHAQVSLRMRRFDEALESLQPLVAATPGDINVMRTYAEALDAAGRHAEADQVLDALIKQAPDARLAVTQHRVRERGKLSAPDAPLEQWLSKNSRDAAVRAVYADSLRAAGENQRAIAQYEMLATQNPQSVLVLNNLAWLYVLEGDKRALEVARRAAQLAPKSRSVADTYGWALVRAGQPKDALPVLRAADQGGGITQPMTRYHLAVAMADTGDSGGSRALLESLLAEAEEFPSREEATRLLAALPASQANVTQ